MEFVSIIIPVYNVEKFIGKCMESVVNQTYTNIEVLVVDDGSQDGSIEIVKAYAKKDPRITIIHQKNQGLSGARNTGLEHAKGDFIYFLDSDDSISLNMIEEMVRCIEDGDICQAPMICVDENGKESSFAYKTREDVFMQDLQLHRELLPYVALYVSGNLYRKDSLRGLRFPVSLVHEDVYYSTILLQSIHKIAFAKEATYYYFTRSNSIMNTKENTKMFDMFEIMKRLHTYFEENEIYNHDFLEKVYVRNFLVSVLYKRARNLPSQYQKIREEKTKEALCFFFQEYKDFKKNPLLTRKEKMFVECFRFSFIRKILWR